MKYYLQIRADGQLSKLMVGRNEDYKWRPSTPREFIDLEPLTGLILDEPGMFVRQQNGKWQLLICFISYDLRDTSCGGNRPIKIKLFLTGNIGETVIALAVQCFQEFVQKTSLLKDYFNNKLKDDFLIHCINSGKSDDVIADEVCSDLFSADWFRKPLTDRSDVASHWYSGIDNDNNKFLTFCDELFNGKREGLAFATQSITIDSLGLFKDWQQDFNCYLNLGIIFFNTQNRGLPYTLLSPPLVHTAVPHRFPNKDSKPSSPILVSRESYKKKAVWILIGVTLLVLLTVLLKNCGNPEKKLERKSQKKSLTSSTIPITTKTQNNNNKK